MNGIPRELNWVKERAACTLAHVFSQLHHGIEEDIKSVNLIHQLPPETVFEMTFLGAGNAFVVKRRASVRPYVRFSLAQDYIETSDDTSEKSEYRITLSNEGRCKLTLHGEELEQWQVRRMALEKLFFAS